MNLYWKASLTAAALLPFGNLLAQDTFNPNTPVTEVTITTDKTQFLYDIKEFTAKAGSILKITLVVPEGSVPQPHNLVIVKPGKEMAVIQGVMQMMADPQGLVKGYVPETADILANTKLIQPGQSDILEIQVPSEVGVYPYLCTFPGHFAIMKGKMNVVE